MKAVSNKSFIKESLFNVISATIIFLALTYFGCKSKQVQKNQKTSSKIVEQSSDGKSQLRLATTNSYSQSQLSKQFDLLVDFKSYTDTIEINDSCLIKIYIKDKVSKSTTDSISLAASFLFSFMFSSSDSMTSYSTKFHADREIVDNYFGDVVVADLNFDGKDDIAVVCDGGGNGGPLYQFYIQTEDLKFMRDNFLTDSVSYFPDEILTSKRQIVTLVHAGACCVGEHIYELDKLTNSWKQTSHKLIGR